MPHVRTPNHSGVDLDGPPPLRARMFPLEASNFEVLAATQFGGNEFDARHGIVVRVRAGPTDLTEDDLGRAMRLATLRRFWPGVSSYTPNCFRGGFRNLPARHLFTR